MICVNVMMPCYGKVAINLRCSLGINRVVKSRGMRWVGNIVYMGGGEKYMQGFYGERIILK